MMYIYKKFSFTSVLLDCVLMEHPIIRLFVSAQRFLNEQNPRKPPVVWGFRLVIDKDT